MLRHDGLLRDILVERIKDKPTRATKGLLTSDIMMKKISPIRSTLTYCQLHSHVTQKLGQKSQIRPR